MTKKQSTTTPEHNSVILVPLNKLKKSPRNARTTPHPVADIEALAASIHANGMLQNPVVEPEVRDGKPTGFYLVTIGEGRRQAQLLRAKRKQIAKTEPIRCTVNSSGNALEISLAENAIRSAMHPADQFEAFHALHRDHGLSDEDIAARFGVTAAVVRQRLKLAAISPKLIEVYRDGGMNLDQLTAFAICDDHARQELVWENLGEDAERSDILEALNLDHIAASDPRAVFVGEEAYRAAGGGILRDLFEPEEEGYFTDPELLLRLAREKLQSLAAQITAEGWKWVEVMPRHDHTFTSSMRRVYAKAAELSDEAQEKLDALESEYVAFEVEDSEESQAELERLEQAIEAARGEDAYDPADIARGGALVTLGWNGEPVVERGFIRPEDDAPKPAKAKAQRAEGPAPLSDKLVAELTAHRTMALRGTLAQSPGVALTALLHALAESVFFPHEERRSCLRVRAQCPPLAHHAPDVMATASAQWLDEAHATWARELGSDPDALWPVIAAMPQERQLRLLAYCVVLTLDAVEAKASRDAKPESPALPVAQALGFDMAAHWQPTAASYFRRVSKERILEAVREAVSHEAAANIASLKKQAMAEAAASRMRGRGWLPPLLRTPLPLQVAEER